MKIKLLTLFALSILCVGASAQTVNITLSTLGYGQNVYIITPGAVTGTTWAGQIGLTATNSSSPGTFANGSYTAFCTELTQHVSTGTTYTYNVVPVEQVPNNPAQMGAVKAAAVRDIYARAAGAQFGADNNFATAFQLAVWEITNDYNGTAGSLNVSSGNFSAAADGSLTAFNATIQADLAYLFGGVGLNNSSGIVGLTNGTSQDFIVAANTFGTTAVPEPGTYAMMFSAGIVVAGFKLRRRKKA